MKDHGLVLGSLFGFVCKIQEKDSVVNMCVALLRSSVGCRHSHFWMIIAFLLLWKLFWNMWTLCL